MSIIHMGALFTRSLDAGNDLGRVAGEIAGRGVDLREGYADSGHAYKFCGYLVAFAAKSRLKLV